MNARVQATQIRRLISITIVCLLITVLVVGVVPERNEYNSYIVQGKSIGEISQLVNKYGGVITSNLEIINGVGALLPQVFVNALLNESSVKAVIPNQTVSLADLTFNKKPKIPTTDYPDVVGADVVWEKGIAGQGVTVAVIDTGIALHPGLVLGINGKVNDRIVGWVDFVNKYRIPHDPNGHGTHIAGIIANSQKGTDGEWNGTAPGVRLVGVRVLDKNGYGTYEQVIQGIQWVIKHKQKLNIKVINLSLVAQVQSPYWADPLNQAVMRAWQEGIVVVVAAGNGGPSPMTIGVPGNNPYVITVGAFTDNYTPNDWSDDYITPFSASGPTLDGFVKPDVVAPGAHMVSTMMPFSTIAKNHDANKIAPNYFSMAGTSQAAAVVSGVASLILSKDPGLTPAQVKYRLMYSSFPWIDLETTEALYSMWQQGAGRINAPDAVFSDINGEANLGLNIQADLAGETHYEGYSYYDSTLGEFRLLGEFHEWTGGYGAWAGNYDAWAGGYGAWAGGYGAWAGGYGAWAGGYGAWAGGYGAWAGGYGAWAGGYGAWAGGYGAWAGGYGAWAGNYGDSEFAERFVNWQNDFGSWSSSTPWVGNWVNFDD